MSLKKNAKLDIFRSNDTNNEKTFVDVFEFYPDDVNSTQVINI